MKLRFTLLPAVLFGTVLLTSSLETTGEEIPQHPFIKPADIKSDTCLTCHPEKRGGKFVHSAVASGCESCHQATSENETTNITLRATGGDLCAMCHQAKEDPVVHGPYKSGQCLVCHEAHTSNFAGVVRAEPNTLCMSCHGVDQPDVKIDKENQSVTLLGGRKITLEEYRKATKLGLDGSGTKGHPIPGHPISGKDPRNKDAPLSCLSCHVPHSSPSLNLLLGEVKADIELCGQCHE